MIRRPWQTWAVFAASLAVVLGAMGWMSTTLLHLDDAQDEARRDADLEENVRLALWRMDSALTPVIVQESLRPTFTYDPFFAANLFACARSGQARPDDVFPSPLLTQSTRHVLVHFQIDADGKVTSPQVPTGKKREMAQSGCTTSENIEESQRRLTELQGLISRESILIALGPSDVPQLAEGPRSVGALPAGRRRQSQASQFAFSGNELAARDLNIGNAVTQNCVDPPSAAFEGDAGVVKPLWIGPTLVLARRVYVGGQEHLQGCWLDWPELRRWLLESIRDLLPNAALEPVRGEPADRNARVLAALPVRLTPGQVVEDAAASPSPIRLSLVVAWACVLVAAGAVAALLLGVLSLSERRAAFVSAVTHELRTPLTTFRMYSEILAGGMVAEEEKRKRYLATLCTEADRLSHLVENVLSFARIEKRGADAGRLETRSVSGILDRAERRLRDRAEQAGMGFEMEAPGEARAAGVRADVAAVEQVLFNLVDNACKYAAGPAARVHLSAAVEGAWVVMRVRDRGPGIAPLEARRLFQPFSKSASEAANSAPGVGLGLALCRRLARGMGGELVLEACVGEGACFALRLRAA